MRFIIRLLINAIALLILAYKLPGFQVDSFYYALVAAVVLGLVNAVIRPILMLLSFPIRLLTLGLFTFVINAILLWVVASLLDGFAIDNFVTALIAAVILWLVSMITGFFVKKKKK